MVDTDYEQYAILRVSLVWRDKDFHVLKYFSKLVLGGGTVSCHGPRGTTRPSP